ncbi:MAG: hypothetical protein ABGW79_12980 [Pirellulales bacterium]
MKADLQKFPWLAVMTCISLGFLCRDATRADELSSQIPDKVSFEGFDIAPGQTRVAQVLGEIRSQDKTVATEDVPLEFLVKGPPNSRAGSGVMVAEVGQEIAFLNIAAGVVADRNSIVDGPSGYTSRLSMDFEGGSVVGGLDLKTKMRNTKKHSTVGIEFGPRLARRFRNGVEVFMKGSAEAVSRYEHGGEMAPTGGPLQRPEEVGVSGSVGLVR